MSLVHNFAQLLYLRPNILPSALFQATALYTRSDDLMSVLRHAMSCGLAENYRSFIKTYALLLRGKDGGHKRLQNVCKILQGHITLLPRRRQSSPSKYIISLKRNTKINIHTRQVIKVHFWPFVKFRKKKYIFVSPSP